MFCFLQLDKIFTVSECVKYRIITKYQNYLNIGIYLSKTNNKAFSNLTKNHISITSTLASVYMHDRIILENRTEPISQSVARERANAELGRNFEGTPDVKRAVVRSQRNYPNKNVAPPPRFFAWESTNCRPKERGSW